MGEFSSICVVFVMWTNCTGYREGACQDSYK